MTPSSRYWQWFCEVAFIFALLSSTTNLLGWTHSPETPMVFMLLAIYAKLS